jgi:hypothetical protein
MYRISHLFVITILFLFPWNSFGQLTEQELLNAIKLEEYQKVEAYFKNKENNPDMLIGKQKVPLIHYAASINNLKVVRILISTGANLNLFYDDDTPLMTAIFFNNNKIIELLLKNGADVNYKNPKGRTAAISAVIYNNPKALEILKKYKADFSVKDNNNKIAIDYAWELQNIECFKLLSNISKNKYSELPGQSYFDGPYVFWENKSKLKATYLISNSLTNKINQFDTVLSFKKDATILAHKKLPFKIPIRRIKRNASTAFEFENVSKIMAIGDLHGEFDTFKNFLINNKVIDKNYNWIFGTGHLLLAGDIFDRGPKVTECLWLLYKLEAEAQKQGGNVHLVIGNHEVMQLSGDKRYLSKKYLMLFNKLGLDYTNAYAKNTELGRWIRSRNTIIRINDILFVHGGLSYNLVKGKIKIKLVNDIVRNILNREDKEPKNAIEELILGNNGPLWYRGYIKMNAGYYSSTGNSYNITQEKVDKITEYFSAKAIVFANTHVKEITSMFNKKLYGIDIPFAEMNVQLQGLLIENNTFYKVFMDGTKKVFK